LATESAVWFELATVSFPNSGVAPMAVPLAARWFRRLLRYLPIIFRERFARRKDSRLRHGPFSLSKDMSPLYTGFGADKMAARFINSCAVVFH